MYFTREKIFIDERWTFSSLIFSSALDIEQVIFTLHRLKYIWGAKFISSKLCVWDASILAAFWF